MKKVMERTFRRMNANRKNGKKALKGFTLVEIIVVLVILAILAAAMIPALTGYIEKAKNKTMVAEARNALTAVQTLASEAYGMGKAWGTAPYTEGEAKDLSEVNGTISGVEFGTKNKVSKMVYTVTSGDETYTITYENGAFGEPAKQAKP